MPTFVPGWFSRPVTFAGLERLFPARRQALIGHRHRRGRRHIKALQHGQVHDLLVIQILMQMAVGLIRYGVPGVKLGAEIIDRRFVRLHRLVGRVLAFSCAMRLG